MFKLDTIILFSLIIPFVMTYRIGPGDTPIWLFGFIFLGLLSSLSLDLGLFKLSPKIYAKIKMSLLWLLIIFSIGSAIFSEIIVRHQTAPIYHVHDIILQQEAAIRFLLHGKNPYAVNYFNTPLAQWHYSDTEVNPALYHFVMQPFYLIFAIPFYISMVKIFGFFDARVPLFFLFFIVLIVMQKIVKTPEKKRLALTLMAFNPAMLGYLIEGRDDIFMYAFLLLGFLFLQKSKNIIAGISMALAFAVKQSAWPFFPFYVFFLYIKKKNFKEVILSLAPFSLVFGIIVLPFFFWNQKAFVDSTILYLSGNVQNSYPIAGYGLGALLHQLGFIASVHQYYPFLIWQLFLSFPLMVGFFIWLRKEISVRKVIIAYGIFLFVFWYSSRYFNNSHLGYLSMVFITAYLWEE